MNPYRRRINDNILKLREHEKLDPRIDDDHRRVFMDQFNWESCQLLLADQTMVERLLVKYHSSFARHRLDIWTNKEFKIKLFPNHNEPVYTQNLTAPTNLKVR